MNNYKIKSIEEMNKSESRLYFRYNIISWISMFLSIISIFTSSIFLVIGFLFIFIISLLISMKIDKSFDFIYKPKKLLNKMEVNNE